jgi:uncharacterized protein (TIGR00255 family)
MLVSMTGFGQADLSDRRGKVSVEIRTVNHRFLDIAAKLPKALMPREPEIRELVKERIARGRVTVTVAAESLVPQLNVSLNVPLMEQYLEELREFAKRHKLGAEIDVTTLASFPEVFTLRENDSVPDLLWPLVEKGMKEALRACAKMRQAEGKAIEKDLSARIGLVKRLVKKAEKRAPQVTAQHKALLKERLTRIMDGARIDSDRWMTEVALLADRVDFTEEITRLNSHLSQFETCLKEGGAVAKRLTYLLQEMHREVTTVSSKAADADVLGIMISLKEETEKLREQVQNLE